MIKSGRKLKPIILFLAAVILIAALCSCGESERTPSDGSISVSADDQPEQLPPAEDSIDYSTLPGRIIKLLEDDSVSFTLGDAEDSQDGYGMLDSTTITLENGGFIYLSRFDSAQSASAYSGYFDETGSSFQSPEETKVNLYSQPVIFWANEEYVICYSAIDGELYVPLCSLLGNPFAGQGSFFPDNPGVFDDKSIDTVTLAVNALDSLGTEYTSEVYDIEPGDGSLGALSEHYYEISNGDSLSVVTFEGEDKSQQYINGFSDDGLIWNDGSVTVDLDYGGAVHIWLRGSEVISYRSETGEHLWTMNRYFGYEAVGAGYDYYRPQYAAGLTEALDQAGVEYKVRRAVAMQNPIYMYQPVSICMVDAGDAGIIYLSCFQDESVALDHASRFSVDGRFYTGLEGMSSITIGFGREYPIHLFRSSEVVVEYSAKSEELLGILEGVFGAEFAGPAAVSGDDYYAVEYTASFVRTYGDLGDTQLPSHQYAIIRSRDELDGFYNSFSGMLNLERSEGLGFLDYADDFDDAYFENGTLILITLSEPSGSISHVVDGVNKNPDGSYSVYIHRVVPEVGTDDIAIWQLFLGLESEKLGPLENVDIVIG